MLFTLFGFSKYYVDSLSENIKRGNRSKAERGWRPSRPPIGYLHDPMTKTICPDPHRFDLVRQMFRLMLSGAHTPRSVHRIAKKEWGLRTVVRKTQGGALVHLSSVNAILRNPFYAGVFKWDGHLVAGRHEPMLTLHEFERVQRVFRRSIGGNADPQIVPVYWPPALRGVWAVNYCRRQAEQPSWKLLYLLPLHSKPTRDPLRGTVRSQGAIGTTDRGVP